MNEELTQAQRRQLEHLDATGKPVGGWKLGLTSGESRDAFGSGIRPFGYILAERIFSDGAAIDWTGIENGGLENELCFVIGEAVSAPVTAESIRAHLAGMAPAFEINERRIPKGSPPAERIEDDLANWGIVIGELRPIPANWAGAELSVTLAYDGSPVDTVAAAGHIDDHFDTLAHLANQLLDYDRQLNAGDRVITGAFGKSAQPEAGRWTGDFGPELGEVSLIVRR